MEKITNLYNAAKTAFIANNYSDKNILLITKDNVEAIKIVNELSFFLPERLTYLFPEYNHSPFEFARVLPDIIDKRIGCLYNIIHNRNYIIAGTSYSILKKLPPRHILESSIISLNKGDSISYDEINYLLDNLDYVNVEIVTSGGEFCIRGGILDLYPTGLEHPVRIEFFGDTIESIIYYDISTYKTIAEITSITILPSSEGIYDTDTFVKNTSNIDVYAEKASTFGKFAGHHWASHLIYPLETIFNYLDESTQIFITDGGLSQIKELVNTIEGKVKTLNYPDPWLYKVFLGEDELIKILDEKKALLFTDFATSNTDQISTIESNKKIYSSRKDNFYKNLDTFVKTIKRHIDTGTTIIISILSEKLLKSLLNFIREYEIAYSFIDNITQIKQQIVNIVRKKFSGGFFNNSNKMLFFTEEEIFGFSRLQTQTKNKAPFKTSLLDLDPDDYVVHIDYGIGRFKGLTHKVVGGIESDYLLLQYAEGELLYVPVHSINKIQKYVGSFDSKPVLSNLKSSRWNNLKKKAYTSAKTLANDLLKLYSERKNLKGFPFKLDNFFLSKLENTFTFEETEDQLTAIYDVFEDMQKSKPMERLICGDVGFGKTEVAVRAACVAVSNDKQVAILTPTTILAHQHYETFKTRFSGLPVNIDYLSRFKEKKDILKTKKLIADGSIDIIIGTHMLLSKDIYFSDLGLLIIDEEQRFGVSHKEKLKSFRTNIDVLTLSATPIPRTLQLSLSGMRDISLIETPPADRLPVITQIINTQEEIDSAILNELKRGGQVYYIHNNTSDIESVSYELKVRLPYAKVIFAYAGMPSHKLECIFDSFYKGEIDILVCTTIIENGIDVGRANTMIVDNAQYFGLSQLYQLKGRVGRSKQRGYFYIFIEDLQNIPPLVKKRIKIIQQLSDLGSGFKIATYDLQLRGAGDILGVEQSGYITNVGYELYIQMVQNAINESMGTFNFTNTTEIQSHIPHYIPAEYIPDYRTRLDLYKKISDINTIDLIFQMADELDKNFGEIPDPAKNYIYTMFIRNIAAKLNIKKITLFKDSAHMIINDSQLYLIDVFKLYKHKNLIIDTSHNKQLIIVKSKDKILPDMSIMLNDLYLEFCSHNLKKQEGVL